MCNNDNTELAWAAGFFDGEGTIVKAGSYSQPIIQIRVVQLDTRPLFRFKDAVSCGNITTWGHMSRWQVAGKKALETLESLWPYLSEPKREQATRRIEEITTRKG